MEMCDHGARRENCSIKNPVALEPEALLVQQRVRLKRSLSLPMIIFYGLGTIVGGGFYALVGKVSAEAGMLTPLAFAVAATIAMFSAFSYAELSARFPYSAGEAHYMLAAFGRNLPAAIVGWAVIATGVVSAATLADAFTGFFCSLVDVPAWLVICAMVIGLGLVAAWGIGQSARLALIITVIELSGLVVVVWAAGNKIDALPDRLPELMPAFSWQAWSGVCLGAYLAFYSFVGFEDMVNVAEEVKRPRRNLPIAILASLALSAVFYVCVTLTMVLAVDQQDLAASDSPLSLAFAKGGRAAELITIVGMLSGLNGALVQIVMASRVAYGMAERRQAPSIFSRVSPATHTPLPATFGVVVVVLALALWLPIVALAKLTSTILLAVYAAVNVSLIVIKLRDGPPQKEGPEYPLWLPVVGAATCIAFIVFHAISLVV